MTTTLTNLNKFKDIPWVIDTETTGLQVIGNPGKHTAKWIGLKPAIDDAIVHVVSISEFNRDLREIVTKDISLVGHNIRFDLHALNLDPEQPLWDTMSFAYYSNTTARKSLDFLAKMRGWPKIETPEELKRGKIDSMNPEVLAEYLADDVDITYRLYKEQAEAGSNLISNIKKDFELERALKKIQSRGVLLLRDKMSEIQERVLGAAKIVEVDIRKLGYDGSLSSPMQLGNWLAANGRHLPTTKTGAFSTSKEVINNLIEKGDAFAEKLLEWRKLTKLNQAFLVPLPELAQEDRWREGFFLYPQVNTTRTATGRFSYDKPNLQQIPKGRDNALGKEIRKCLTHEGGVSVADYSQVELRIAAALSGEPTLLEAFAAGGDPHGETAAKVFGKPFKDVTPVERHAAKTVNFGILFGAGPNRLATELRISLEEARKIFYDWKRGLSKMANWCEQMWANCEHGQYATTVAGRRRVFGGDESTRPGLSVIVQGSAAEIMRASLIAAENAGLEPILSVHDEIIVRGQGKEKELAEVMQESAENAFKKYFSAVSFPADGSSGETWGETD